MVEKAALKKQPSSFRCATCKHLLKTLILALLALVAHWLLAGHIIAGHALKGLIAFIKKELPKLLKVFEKLIPQKGLRDKLLELLKDYIDAPIDSVMERVCRLLAQCALEPAIA